MEYCQTGCQAGCYDAGVGSAGSVAVWLSSLHTSTAPYETTDDQQEAAASDTPTRNIIYIYAYSFLIKGTVSLKI